jgi:diguanylate cyclase
MLPNSTSSSSPTTVINTINGLEDLAASTLKTIRTHGLPATPHIFQGLFRHFSAPQADLPLSELLALLAAQDTTAAGALAADAEVVQEGALALRDEAGRLVTALAGTEAVLARYGAVLDGCASTLGPKNSEGLLVQSVALLAQETARMSAQNNLLVGELRASTARVGQLRQSLAVVRQEASVDGLTGIANRRAFDARLRRQLGQARRNEAAPFCLVLLDVDHFKRFNDTHGHRTGDRVLRLVAQMLTANVKGKDFVARYGGEEFAILLGDVDEETAAAIARQICSRLAAKKIVKRETGEEIGAITLSAGVSLVRLNDTQGSLVERADRALYEAKHEGRNRVYVARYHSEL